MRKLIKLVIPKISKILLTSSLIAGSFVLGACGKELGVKIFRSKTDLGGIYRAQDKELIKYENTEGYFCVSESDMRKLVEAYSACKKLDGVE